MSRRTLMNVSEWRNLRSLSVGIPQAHDSAVIVCNISSAASINMSESESLNNNYFDSWRFRFFSISLSLLPPLLRLTLMKFDISHTHSHPISMTSTYVRSVSGRDSRFVRSQFNVGIMMILHTDYGEENSLSAAPQKVFSIEITPLRESEGTLSIICSSSLEESEGEIFIFNKILLR